MRRGGVWRSVVVAVAVAVALAGGGLARTRTLLASPQATSAADSATHDCRMAMVPMRDGVKLRTKVCTMRGAAQPLPILLTRTPYGIDGLELIGNQYRFLAADGYQFVYQDIRGRYGSEGKFAMNVPLHTVGDARKTDEATDAYDTIDWLVRNVPNNNGRVGVLGVSYPGFLATMAGIHPHPALKAISPQAPMTDTWLGDDFFHQGAFRLSYGFEYAGDMELSNNSSVPLPIGAWDTYQWYLDLGPLANVEAKYFKGRVPTWTAFTQHPAYDAYWKARAVETHVERAEVPTLTVGGWWDQEDRFGPLATYKALERADAAGRNFLVMGPWNHGGWRRADRRMPVVDPGTADDFLRNVERPFFAKYLKDAPGVTVPEARLDDAGAREWRTFDVWPPRDRVTPRSLYLRAGGRLSFEPPTEGDIAFDQYVSDPANPVPYRPRPVEQTYDPRGSRWRTWETEDQRFVDGRPDVLTYRSEPLDADLTIAGDVTARLVAATTGRDADWVVKLIDVFPDSVPDDWSMGGYELMVAHEIMRGRYRKSFTTPEPIQPNAPTPFTVDLHQQAYTFRKGHRVMVQVQSTWFPLYDRNPQTWVRNIFQARPVDFQSKTHRIWHTPSQASRVDVTVLAGR
ncbi:MAG TPA: CocE/NonD family hydrolase [Gemmatimonadaceae bacterium]|nr:CocE/NonD family hydrolase [Gemmatimonadaceae bacterium]